MDNDDWKLLQEFARENAGGAFHALVRRYAGLVHASAFRQTGDAEMAQDVAQAVFTLLARKAGSLRSGTVLSGWLFQTTRFVAARALRADQRRRRREQEAFDMQQLLSGEEAWRQMAPVIDDAVSRLGANDREAILLRYFEGRSVREVGLALGISEEGAKKRLARAMEKLRRVLSRGGVAVSTALISSAFAERAVASVPESLMTTLANGALHAEAGSSAAAILVNESMAAWRRLKAMWMTGAGATLIAVVLFVPVLQKQFFATQDGLAVRPSPVEATSEAGAGRVGPDRSTPPIERNLRQLALRAIDGASGAPVSNAPVVLATWRKTRARTLEEARTIEEFVTDEQGVCHLAIPADAPWINVGVAAAGWGARYVTWPSEGQSEIPPAYTLRLTRVTNVLGGWIRDPSGRPLAGVEVFFQGHDSGDSSHRERPRERFGFADSIRIARTDASGRWSFSIVPPAHPGFQIEARHSDYADTMLVSSGRQGGLDEIKDDKLRDLWEGRLVSGMKASFTLTGLIVDEKAAPIRNARIQHREQSQIFLTDEEGRFAVPKLEEGSWMFTVTADGFAPVRTNANIGSSAQSAPKIVELKPGAAMRLRVVDENGIEVPDAEVGVQRWGESPVEFEWRARTDYRGRIEWRSAPPIVELELFARKDGFCYTRNIRLVADGAEHTIAIHRTLDLYGRVVDAGTGLPIPQFKAMPGYGRDDRYHDASLRWFAAETVAGSNGIFKLTFMEKEYPWQVRVRADGYEDWTSEALTNRIQDVIDVALLPSRPENSVRGVVLGPDGLAAAGAQVALLTFEHSVVLRQRRFEGSKQWVIPANADGAFSFPPNRQAHSVAAVSDTGYVLQRVTGVHDPLTLRLEPWGRVEGVVDESAVGPALASVELYDPAADNYQGRVSLLGSYSTKPDEGRHFVFENVPSGEFCVFVNSNMGIPYHHQMPITVRPGETTQVILSEKPGTRIKGRFVAPVGKHVDWRKDFVLAHFYANLPQSGQFINPGPKADLRRREFEFWTSAQGREHVNKPRVYSGVVLDDGSFASLEPLPPGKYRFTTVFKGSSATLSIEVAEGMSETVDLGAVQLR